MTKRRVLAGAVAALLAMCVVSACTPAQFQAWWVGQGHPPMAEPQLSQAAKGATDFWNEAARRNRYAVQVRPIDAGLAARMTPSSWRAGCPVPLSSLRYLRIPYMGFDGREHLGEMVVHADAVAVVGAAFEVMWDDRFPIRSMRLVDDFGGSDDASMAADNTSAFNCRSVAGTSTWSQHALGRAVDINPVENPWVSGSTFDPPAGAAFGVRSNVRAGMLVPGSPPVRAFEFLGWGWGGRWSSTKDHQHVSANGR